jgi:hypothetical protein
VRQAIESDFAEMTFEGGGELVEDVNWDSGLETIESHNKCKVVLKEIPLGDKLEV